MLLGQHIFFLVFIFIYLKSRRRGSLYLSVHSPRCLPPLELCQARTWSLKLHPSLPYGWQEPRHLMGHRLLPPGRCREETGSEVEQLRRTHTDTELRHPKWSPTSLYHHGHPKASILDTVSPQYSTLMWKRWSQQRK